ncbi:MAG TPA: PTS beta-glucoside transporter subunit EIIBCA [Lachnospiraceae bacterium]|nr:PTS beta-glucoside transporter subunit EIIBCA [Lachnospiraceae bacterium]
MSKKYEKAAVEIISAIGGAENVDAARHCQTRLRFVLRDQGKVDQKKLEENPAVLKVIPTEGMYQIVIGTDVADCYEEIVKLLPQDKRGDKKEEEVKTRKSPVTAVIDFISGTFQPVILALSGAGMLKALMALLVVFHAIDTDSQTYYIINFFADAVFYFLPILLAFCQAQKMKCNPVLAAAVAGIMMHPSWAALVAAGEPVSFFGIIPFTLVSYVSTVIPIIFVIFVQSYVEKFFNRVIPKAINLVFVPMLTFLVMGTLALSVLGPIGNIIGQYLAVFFTFLSENASWAPAFLIGAFLPPMVMFGLHNGVAPLGVMQMSQLGYDSIFGPGCVCSNIAQGTAALVVTFRTKDAKTRQLATSSGITALMGITEPVLYGVNLPKKYPLIAAMVGGGCGGLYAGLTHTHRFATGSSGLPAVLLYIGGDSMQFFINIIIALVITAIVTAVVTFALSLKFEATEREEEIPADIDLPKNTVLAPAEGRLIVMEQIPDETFASGVLGKGVGIWPVQGTITAPFSGTVTQVADTGHALGLTGDDGMELLIHVGIDTVDMNGKGFTPQVKEGDRIRPGQTVLKFDREAIAAANHSDVVVVMLTNADDYPDIVCAPAGTVHADTQIIKAGLVTGGII